MAVSRLDSAQIVGRRLTGPSISNNFERDLLSLTETLHSRAFDRADMDEDILAAVVGLNETEAFLATEPLHGSLRHGTLPLKLRLLRAAMAQPAKFEFWEKVVSLARSSRRGQVIRPKLEA